MQLSENRNYRNDTEGGWNSMNVMVHNLMAYNHQFFRPQPVVNPKQERSNKKKQSFQEVLNEKMKVYGTYKNIK